MLATWLAAHSTTLWLLLCRQRTGLTDGKWVFQVAALAASGVTGSTVSFPFLVDSTAPTIINFTVGYTDGKKAVNQSVANMGQVQVPATAFTVYFVVDDGLLGSGVTPDG